MNEGPETESKQNDVQNTAHFGVAFYQSHSFLNTFI